MSNNEMVSVSRELVQRMIDCAEAYVDIDDADLIELRALLAAPACSLCRDLGDTCIECEKASSVTRLQAELAALKAQPQDEPVPLTAVGVLRDDGDGGLVPEWILEGGTAELWDGATLLIADVDPDLCVDDGHCELYRVPPAPVAVVLPERLSYPMQEDYDDVEEFLEAWSKASAHNACLDEVARLNSL
ncbi:hypothetical protein [Pseudomonas chlororaphis]|uniref:hypothetical protein n=1 Tax=Pseudomonas chlororaphis TaxID=587753 RepID=UPI003C296F28